MYATKTGNYRNHIALDKKLKTMAQMLSEQGYETGYIGKWHLGSSDPVKKEERGGYDYWLGSNLLEFTSDSYDTIVYDGDNNKIKLPGYRIDSIVDAAIRYINDHQTKPFFLFISLIEPHHQNQLLWSLHTYHLANAPLRCASHNARHHSVPDLRKLQLEP